MSENNSAAKLEIEIKTRLADRATFAASLPALGFQLKTAEKMERNTLFDTRDGQLRQRRQLLRIRRYGDHWKLTHKAPAELDGSTKHKARIETETEVVDGNALAAVFGRLGYQPVFIYEKIRAEWTDGEGDIVIDKTPIGDFAELEGEHEWIDKVAARLGIQPSQYLTASYGQLFLDWKKATKHPAANMTFAEVAETGARGV
jgi:adenylate cyclase class 2